MDDANKEKREMKSCSTDTEIFFKPAGPPEPQPTLREILLTSSRKRVCEILVITVIAAGLIALMQTCSPG